MKIGRLEIRMWPGQITIYDELLDLVRKYEIWCLKNKLPESKKQRSELNKIVYGFRKLGRMEGIRQ